MHYDINKFRSDIREDSWIGRRVARHHSGEGGALLSFNTSEPHAPRFSLLQPPSFHGIKTPELFSQNTRLNHAGSGTS